MLYAIVAVIALILDQAIKYWTTVHIPVDVGQEPLIPGIIHLTNIHNTGAAFSFLEGARWFFVIICLIFVAIVVYALVKDMVNTPISRWMAVLVLAGAVGNCIDRVVCGYVVDMFEFEFFRFPVFNMADIYITVGCIAFCLCMFLEKEPAKEGAASREAPAPAASAQSAGISLPRRRKKTPIPTFPKHEPIVQPKMDPNDPFAEWERRANAQPQAQDSPKAAPVYETPVYETPAAPVSEAPKAAPAKSVESAPKAEPKADETSFDLDDILAEFRDL